MKEQKIYRINMEMGAHYFATFDSISLPTEDGTTIFCQVDDSGELCSKSMIRIDEKNGTVGLLYDIFTVITQIGTKKEVDGNIHLVCSNDLFPTINIYICEITQWVSLGKQIFHSK